MKNFIRQMLLVIIVLTMSFLTPPTSAHAASVIDGFDPNVTGLVYTVAVQADGKAIIGGQFTAVGGTSCSNLARLNVDGSFDTTFVPPPNADGPIYALAVQPDGKILVGGAFTNYSGVRFTRLNSDGSLDTTFNDTLNNPGFIDAKVVAIALQPDGKILIGGDFTSVAGTSRNHIARVNPDGTLDTGFNPGADLQISAQVSAIAVQHDKKIIIGGLFANRIARLNADGTNDTSFNVYANNYVSAIVVQADGKILAGGAFTTVNDGAHNYLVRLNSADGTVDTAFTPDLSGGSQVISIAVQTDGKIIAGGIFATAGVTPRNNIVRLNAADGSVDAGFDPNTNGAVYSIVQQPDRNILIGGTFSSLQPNGDASPTTRNHVARLKISATPQVIAIAAGAAHTAALKSDGTVIVWGLNTYGQTSVPVGLSGVIAIAAGGYHTVALKNDGTVVAWGWNYSGQTAIPSGLSGVIAIAAGAYHTVALKNDGTVVAWGGVNYNNGQAIVPSGLSGVIAIAAGWEHTLALKNDGTVVAWGLYSSGQINIPAGLSGVIAISAGQNYSVALKNDGTVVAWGGLTSVPADLSSVTAISAGWYHTVALKNDDTVVTWGSNTSGQTAVPAGLTGVIAIAAGGSHSVALKNDGTVVAWGDNSSGQTTANYTITVNPAGLVTSGQAVTITADSGNLNCSWDGSTASGCVSGSILQTSRVVLTATVPVHTYIAWGAGCDSTTAVTCTINSLTSNMTIALLSDIRQNQTIGAISFSPASPVAGGSSTASAGATSGLDVLFTSLTPRVCTISGTTVTGVAAGTCTIATSQPGDDNYNAAPQVLQNINVISSTGVIAIAAGQYHTVALKSDGTVVTWGSIEYGQITVPTGLSGVAAVAAGYSHIVALKSDGTVVAWGNNGYGQTTVPTGLSGIIAIAAGQYHTVALKSDGTVVAWGDNSLGQTTVPTGLSGVFAIAAGGSHTVALKNDGTVVAWGSNGSGQTAVPTGLTGVIAISGGVSSTVALKNDGTVVTWGDNSFGQSTVPTGLSGIIAIAAGYRHTLALKNDGTVVAWGANTQNMATVPVGLSGVIAIAAGYYHSVALKSDGAVVAWGYNGYGQTTFPSYTTTVNPSGPVPPGQAVTITADSGNINCTWNGTTASGTCVSDKIITANRVILTATVPANTNIVWGAGCNSTTAVTCTINSLASNMTIPLVTSVQIQNYTVTPSAGAGGSITPSTPQTVDTYGAAPFTITPDANHHIADVLVDGNSVGAVTSYTFANVTANHTISASFAANGDTTSPTDGTLTATPGNGQVTLSWTAATDNVGVTGYKLVYDTASLPAVKCTNGTQIDISGGLSVVHSSLTNGATYSYRVCATDAGGNWSTGATASVSPATMSPITGNCDILANTVTAQGVPLGVKSSGHLQLRVPNGLTECSVHWGVTRIAHVTGSEASGNLYYMDLRWNWSYDIVETPTPPDDPAQWGAAGFGLGMQVNPGPSEIQGNIGQGWNTYWNHTNPGGVIDYNSNWDVATGAGGELPSTGKFALQEGDYTLHQDITLSLSKGPNDTGMTADYNFEQVDTLNPVAGVTTAAIKEITRTTATAGGNIIPYAGASVTNRGVCWSASANPTMNDQCIQIGSGTGSFAGAITGLTPNTLYHVRSYATNINGTAYGSDVAFTTLEATPPTAAITYSPTGPYKSGTAVTITATFSEAMADVPVPQIALSGADSLSATDMVRSDASHYSLTYTAGNGNGAVSTSLSTGTDLAGNVITSLPTSGSSFILDNTPPAGSISINYGAAYTRNPTVTLTLACADTGSGCARMQLSNDNTNWTPAESYSTGKSWTLANGDGAKTVYVKFQDVAGNWSTLIISSGIMLDTSPPVGTLAATANSSSQIYLSWSGFSDSGSGLAATNPYKLVRATGATAPVDCSGTAIYQGATTYLYDTSLLAGTRYAYRICAYDRAGNASTGATAGATTLQTYTLTTSVAGTGGASGSVSPASGTFDAGSYHSISANPDSISAFDHWSGDCGGTSSSFSFSIAGNMSCTANFAPLPAPRVTGTTPLAGATGVGTTTSITATFNVPLKQASVDTTTFIVRDQGNNPVTGTVSYYSNQVTFTPASALSGGTTYTVTVTTGVQNAAGAPITANYSWSFTTYPELGGVASEGNLRITPMSDGRIGVYRYMSGAWQQQVYSGFSKGSRLQVNGTGYPMGYFSNGTSPNLASHTQLSATQTRTEWTTTDGLRITQDLTYLPGSAYYGLTWKITNESSADKSDLRFFHGEDTFFYGDDTGAGFWDPSNNTIGVQRTYNGTDLRRMSLQAITTPFAYDSEYYDTVRSNVNNGALKKVIKADKNENGIYPDNGYALEWRNATLPAGTAWTISAFEKFADVQVGTVSVTAPITTTCTAGASCTLTYTVTNSTISPANVTLTLTPDQTGWSATTAATALTINANSSQQVVVQLAIPAGVANGFIGHLTLSANDGSITVSDTGAIHVIASNQTISFGTPPALTYGGATGAISATATSGLPVTLTSLTPAVCTVSNTTVTPVTAGTCTIAANQTGNGTYSAAEQATQDIIVGTATLTITAVAASKTYGAAEPELTYTATGLVSPDTLSGSLARTAGENVNTYAILQGSVAVSSPGNYTVTFVPANLTIGKATPVITWPTPNTITYGTPLSTTQLNASANVHGAYAYTPASGTLSVGAGQTLSVIFTPDDTVNYTRQSATTTISVTAAGQSISFGAAPGLTYGGAPGTVTASATSGLGITYSSLTPGVCTVNGSTVAPVTAGTCTIAANQTGNGNYSAAQQATLNITVAKATPVITWGKPADIISGAALGDTQLNASANVDGSFAYTPPSGTVPGIGVGQTLSATFTPHDAANYTGQNATTTLSVLVDTIAPEITSFTMPPTSADFKVAITSFTTDNIGFTGYLLTEIPTRPAAEDLAWKTTRPTAYTFTTWGNHILYAYARDAIGNISTGKPASVYIGTSPDADGLIVPAAGKTAPDIHDALKSLNFAMGVEKPTESEKLHADVAPLVHGIPQPDGENNLGDTIVILRRVVGL